MRKLMIAIWVVMILGTVGIATSIQAEDIQKGRCDYLLKQSEKYYKKSDSTIDIEKFRYERLGINYHEQYKKCLNGKIVRNYQTIKLEQKQVISQQTK